MKIKQTISITDQKARGTPQMSLSSEFLKYMNTQGQTDAEIIHPTPIAVNGMQHNLVLNFHTYRHIIPSRVDNMEELLIKSTLGQLTFSANLVSWIAKTCTTWSRYATEDLADHVSPKDVAQVQASVIYDILYEEDLFALPADKRPTEGRQLRERFVEFSVGHQKASDIMRQYYDRVGFTLQIDKTTL